MVRSGHWSFDVGYFIVSALDVEGRRAHAAELVEEYRRALEVPESERPTREEAWLRFRSSPPYRLAIWVTTGAEDGYQAPAIASTSPSASAGPSSTWTRPAPSPSSASEPPAALK